MASRTLIEGGSVVTADRTIGGFAGGDVLVEPNTTGRPVLPGGDRIPGAHEAQEA
jgi:hypothetical protein